MKPSIASFLSISAIVVAGGAALAVNARVFNAPPTSATSGAPEVLAVAARGSEVAVNDVGIGELGSSDTTVVDGGASSTPVIANDTSTTLSDYDIPGVGVVTLAQTGSTITVENVTTEAGYTYAASEPFPGRLDVRFTSDAVEVEFDAQLIDGRVVTVLRSRALGVSGAKAESRDGNRRRENDGERDGEHEEDDDD